jgi:YVTN family beta-propeller protein
MVTDPVRNTLYIASKGSNTVVAWDQATESVITTIGVDRAPWGIGYVNDRIFLASSNSANITVIDPASRTRTKEIPLQDRFNAVQCAGMPANIATHPFRNLAYVALYGTIGRVAVIDAVSNSLVGCLNTAQGTFSVAVDPYADRLYVTNRDAFNLMVFDTSTVPGTLIQTIPLNGAPFMVQTNVFNGEVYVMVAHDSPDYSSANFLTVFTPSTSGLTLKTTAIVGNTDDGGSLSVSSFTGAIYLSATRDNVLQILDPTTYAVLQAIPMLDPFGIAENTNLNKTYVGNRVTSTLSVLPADIGP